MKITKSKLKQIIKEELENYLNEDEADEWWVDGVKRACEDTKRGAMYRDELRASSSVMAAQLMSKSKKQCPDIWAKDRRRA